MNNIFPFPGLHHLPRLRAVLVDVLDVEPAQVPLDLDLAEALACDERDRTEVITVMQRMFGVAVSGREAGACESVADLLRLVADKHPSRSVAYA